MKGGVGDNNGAVERHCCIGREDGSEREWRTAEAALSGLSHPDLEC